MVFIPSIFGMKWNNGSGMSRYFPASKCLFLTPIQIRRLNPKHEAIIVIDAMSLIHLTARDVADNLCGGRHHKYYNLFGRLFADLKSCGCRLVFFSDLNVQHQKVDEWLRRRTEEYDKTIVLFDQIAQGMPVEAIVRECDDPKSLMTAMNALRTEALKHGEFMYVTQRECDTELAKYARDKNAVAVIANDSDFLIFAGKWKYWSAKDIDLETLDTMAYNREALCSYLSLSHQQMALWATLIVNDITNSCYRDLRRFHGSLGPIDQKFVNVARYVRSIRYQPFSFDQRTIDSIARNVSGDRFYRRTSPLIAESISSYDLDYPPEMITDPLLLKAMPHSAIYAKLQTDIHTLTLTKYDFRCADIRRTYTEVMAKVEQRAIGVVWRERGRHPSIKLMAKWSHGEPWCRTDMPPIFPPNHCECGLHRMSLLHTQISIFARSFSFTVQLPPLMTLLFEADVNIDSTLNATRWQLILWMLSMSPDIMERIKQVEIEFRLIAVVLLFMVQVHII